MRIKSGEKGLRRANSPICSANKAEAVRGILLRRLEAEIDSLPEESIGAETTVITTTKIGRHTVEQKTTYSLMNLVKAFRDLTEDIQGASYEPVAIIWGDQKPDESKHNIIIDV